MNKCCNRVAKLCCNNVVSLVEKAIGIATSNLSALLQHGTKFIYDIDSRYIHSYHSH